MESKQFNFVQPIAATKSAVVADAFPRNASQSNKNLDLLQNVIRVAASFSCPDLDCFHIPTSTWTTAV